MHLRGRSRSGTLHLHPPRTPAQIGGRLWPQENPKPRGHRRARTQPTFFSLSPVCQSLSRVRLFVTPGTVACQSPLSMGFSRQEYWSALPFPSPSLSREA